MRPPTVFRRAVSILDNILGDFPAESFTIFAWCETCGHRGTLDRTRVGDDTRIRERRPGRQWGVSGDPAPCPLSHDLSSDQRKDRICPTSTPYISAARASRFVCSWAGHSVSSASSPARIVSRAASSSALSRAIFSGVWGFLSMTWPAQQRQGDRFGVLQSAPSEGRSFSGIGRIVTSSSTR